MLNGRFGVVGWCTLFSSIYHVIVVSVGSSYRLHRHEGIWRESAMCTQIKWKWLEKLKIDFFSYLTVREKEMKGTRHRFFFQFPFVELMCHTALHRKHTRYQIQRKLHFFVCAFIRIVISLFVLSLLSFWLCQFGNCEYGTIRHNPNAIPL